MKETFERVAEHLYKRQYQTAGGDWRTIYYGRFVDWKGKRRMFTLGGELKAARQGLALIEARNVKQENFDQDKIKGMTLAEWLDRYLALVKHTASGATKNSQCIHLKRLLGLLVSRNYESSDHGI